jgi:hypothetical protein
MYNLKGCASSHHDLPMFFHQTLLFQVLSFPRFLSNQESGVVIIIGLLLGLLFKVSLGAASWSKR